MNLQSTTELTNQGISFETIVVPNGVHTVEDVERSCNCTKQEVIKTLLFVGQKPIMVLISGDKKADIGKLKNVRGDESLRMANKIEVLTITGYTVGTVSPFGLPSNLDLLADNDLKDLPYLITGSGKNDTLLKLSQPEFAKSFKGFFASITI